MPADRTYSIQPDRVTPLADRKSPQTAGSQVISWLALLLLTFSPLTLSGCSSNLKWHKRIWSPKQAKKVLRESLDAKLPDLRRRAIERVHNSKYVKSDICVQTMSVIVRTDKSQTVRRAAACSLGASGQLTAIEPLLLVLDYNQHRERVLSPDGPLRRACLDALKQLFAAGLEYDNLDKVANLVIITLNRDQDREVRIAAAGLLGNFQRNDVLSALIEALRQPDFAVNYEAEKSLVKLTGSTNHRNYEAWRAWLDKTPEPFTQAGQPATGSR